MAKKSQTTEATDPKATAEAAKAKLEKLKAEMAETRKQLKEAKAASTKKTTRIDATVKALKEMDGDTITLDDLAKTASDIYVKAGGVDKLTRAKEDAKFVVNVLVALDRASVSGKEITIKEL